MIDDNLLDIGPLAEAVLRVQAKLRVPKPEAELVAVTQTDALLLTGMLTRLFSWTLSWRRAEERWARRTGSWPSEDHALPEAPAQLIEVRNSSQELLFMCPRCLDAGHHFVGDYSAFAIDLAFEGECQACRNADRPYLVIHQQAAEKLDAES